MKEIERRFLTNGIPLDDSFKRFEIMQGYIFFMPVLRLRRQNTQYFLTMKAAGALVRNEFEIPISKEDFDLMWEKVEGTPIIKTRYLVPLDCGNTAELDIFGGNLAPLKIAEVEFKSLEAAECFIPPEWFGKEVTYSKEYSNSSLSKYGLPKEI